VDCFDIFIIVLVHYLLFMPYVHLGHDHLVATVSQLSHFKMREKTPIRNKHKQTVFFACHDKALLCRQCR